MNMCKTLRRVPEGVRALQVLIIMGNTTHNSYVMMRNLSLASP